MALALAHLPAGHVAAVQGFAYGAGALLAACAVHGWILGGSDGAGVGLVNRLVPDAEVREAALALAGQVAALPPGGVQAPSGSCTR